MILEDSLIELKSTKIWKYLNDTDNMYAERAICFVNHITPILKSIQEVFPLYTRHDAHHGYRVLTRMEQVIKSDCLKKGKRLSFKNIEAFLLICSAYAHDLGMAVFPNEKEDLLGQLGIKSDSDWRSNSLLQSHLREKHSERGGVFINGNYEILKFPKSLVSHLNLLMKAHNMTINEIDSELSGRMAGGDSEIDIRQLACILCVADSLEFSETRILEGVIDLLNDRIKNTEDKEALKSYQENMKHLCIGDNLAISNKDKRIIVSGSFDDAEVLNLAHKTIDYIEDWVRMYLDLDYRSSLKRLSIQGDLVERNLTILGSDFVRLGIRIKKDHIINLISSNTTWNNHSVAIKELLQNSVEACRYRLFHSSDADNYSPLIKVVINKKEREIRLTDNGCGMSRNTILNNFLTVGNSRSLDSAYSHGSFKSLARFGIGFWSVFTISNDADIISAPFEYLRNNDNTSDQVKGLQFSVSVSEFKDYSLFKEISGIPGTSITLNIKPEISLDELVSGLNSMLICSAIPIEIWNDDELYLVPSNVELPSLKEITEAKYEFALFQGIKEYIFNKKYDELEINIKLLFRRENHVPTFMLKEGFNSLMNITRSSRSLRFAICGFTVNTKSFNFDSVFNIDSVFNFGGVGFVVCNINNPDGFVYNILRLELLPSPKLDEVIDLIMIGIHDGYRQFLVDNHVYDKKSIYELNRQSGASYPLTSRHYTNSKLCNLNKVCPDLLIFKLFNIEVGKDMFSANTIFLTTNELCSQKYDLWSCDPLNYRKEEESHIKSLPYQLILDYSKGKSDVFYLSASSEFDMLFDNDPNSFIEILPNPSYSDFRRPFIPFMRVTSNTIVLTDEHPGFICSIIGIWSGTILEKKIIGGSNFIFIGQFKLIVNPDSLLCSRIHELNNNGQIIKLCNLVNLLSDTIHGFVDKSVEEFF